MVDTSKLKVGDFYTAPSGLSYKVSASDDISKLKVKSIIPSTPVVKTMPTSKGYSGGAYLDVDSTQNILGITQITGTPINNFNIPKDIIMNNPDLTKGSNVSVGNHGEITNTNTPPPSTNGNNPVDNAISSLFGGNGESLGNKIQNGAIIGLGAIALALFLVTVIKK
jgi:hypothetical protein